MRLNEIVARRRAAKDSLAGWSWRVRRPGQDLRPWREGQRARKGGYHKVGFEGGQMPLQRRLPKFGFRSKIAPMVAEVRLSELAKVPVTSSILKR